MEFIDRLKVTITFDEIKFRKSDTNEIALDELLI